MIYQAILSLQIQWQIDKSVYDIKSWFQMIIWMHGGKTYNSQVDYFSQKRVLKLVRNNY